MNGAARFLLALDTSTEQAGVALFDGDRVVELLWPAGRDQTRVLLAQVDRLLGLAGIAVSDLAAVAVAAGPGTFNGLRVGHGLAKGLILATGIPLIGVPTLAAAALPHRAWHGVVVPVLAAGRGRLVWAEIPRGDDPTPPRNGTPVELLARVIEIGAAALVTGEFPAALAADLAAAGAAVSPPALRVRRPASVAQLAWDRLLAGDADDAATLEPVYLHGAPAVG